jgi:hypothetical protein
MLSDNLAKGIVDYRTMKSKGRTTKSKGHPATFYLYSYVMDAICFMTPFPLMNWSWTPSSSKPIHFCQSKLWEEKAKDLFYEICHNVVVPVHIDIYGCLNFREDYGKPRKDRKLVH